MLRILLVISFSFLYLLTVCAEKPSLVAKTNAQTNEVKQKLTPKMISRGEALPPNGECLSLDDISDSPKKYAGQKVIVEGAVAAVCQAKGCWMTIAGDKATARARVTFKEYAFFVPKDVKGKKVKVMGEVKVKMLSDGERAHLAEDGRVDVSEIPKAELRLVASGVEIHQ